MISGEEFRTRVKALYPALDNGDHGRLEEFTALVEAHRPKPKGRRPCCDCGVPVRGKRCVICNTRYQFYRRRLPA